MTIGIVTAFFDIGRGDWGSRPGIPPWLPRSVESYFECFERMCRLENEIVVFTEEKFKNRVLSLRAKYGHSERTHVFCPDIFSEHRKEPDDIARVMSHPSFLDGVVTPYAPEYWEPRYVLINYLKSTFALRAIESGVFKADRVAWTDFAYCREDSCLPRGLCWDYPFSEKVHLFNLAPIHPVNLVEVIKTNTVYFQGGIIVASPDKWPRLRRLMRMSFDFLIANNLIDDDQTLLLMSYWGEPALFETHALDALNRGWFTILADYNVTSALPE